MIVLLYLPLLLELATFMVEAQVKKIQLESINATCNGKTCPNYSVQICHAGKGIPATTEKCLEIIDKDFFQNYTFYLRSAVKPTFFALNSGNKIPERFFIFLNKQTSALEEKTSRRFNATTIILNLQNRSSDLETPSLIFEVELTSVCENSNCTRFMCDICHRPIVNISTVPPVPVGVNVTIHCHISPYSEVTTVNWLKYQNNLTTLIDINDKGRFNGGTVTRPSLTIYSVEVEDSGNYTCRAINAVGETLSVPVHLGVYDVTTNIKPTADQNPTDHTFVTSELPTPSPDSVSPTVSTIKPSIRSSSVDTTTTTPIISTIKPSIGSSSVDTTTTTSTISTIKPSIGLSIVETSTTTLTLSTRMPRIGLSSVDTSTTTPIISTIKPSTISSSVDTTTTTPTDMLTTTSPTFSTTVITYTSTKSTIRSTSKYITTSASAKPPSTVKFKVNSENLNAWVITTTMICVVEFIVIVLVIYVMWLRKQRRLAMEYEKEDTAF